LVGPGVCYIITALLHIELHPGEKERPLNRLKPRRLGVWGLLFALLLGGKALWTVPHLMAQPAHPGAIVSGPGRVGLVSEPIEEPAHLGGDRIGKLKAPVQPAEEGYGVVYRSEQGAESTAREDRLQDEAPSVWREEAEYDDSALGPEHEGLVEEEEAEYGMFEEGDDSAKEWIDEGGEPGEAYADGAVVVPFGVPGDVGRVEEEKNKGVVGMQKGLLFGQRLSAEKTSLGLSPDRYRYPDQLMEPLWTHCLAVLEDGSIAPLRSALNRLYEAKLDAGFRNMPDYATLLVRRAYRLFEEGDFLEARLVGEAAYNLAPEYYPVSSALSDLVRMDPQRGVGRYLHWRWVSLKQRIHDFLWQFTTAGKVFALGLMALYLFFLALGFYLLGRYARVLFHFVHERLPVGPVGMGAVGAVLMATVVVLLFLPGPFWVTVFLGFVTGRFVRRWEKACYTLFLLLWAVSPWLFNQTVCFFSPLSDATNSIQRCMQGEWNAAGEEALNAAVQTDPGSLDLQLTKALVEKRRGDYEQAARVLRRALLAYPQTGSLWNNLGNLHAIRGDLEEAKAAYQKAVLYGNGSAAPHYNMSQLLRREFAFLKGAQEYQTARRIDAERVDYFTYIHSPNPNRFFMDEEPRKGALWRHAFYRDTETERAADDVWRSTAAGIPLQQATWVFLALTGVYVLFVARRRSGQEPFACSGCGKIVCGKCDRGAEAGGLCSPCYQALYQRENISKERRHGQIRKMARFQSRRSRKLLIVNLLLPGLGFSLLEEKPRGMLILFGFFFFLLLTGFWGNMLPVPMTVWETGGSVLRILAILLLIPLYVLIQQKFVTKLRARR
jgi:tetratricopeptide (TPR) repeat protein